MIDEHLENLRRLCIEQPLKAADRMADFERQLAERHAAKDGQFCKWDLQLCKWEFDKWDEAYETDCGQYWVFTDGGPAENNVRFCHYCGRKVREVSDE